MSKPVLIFKCNCRLKEESKEKIRENLKRQIDEGVAVIDLSIDYIKTVLPGNCDYEIIVEDFGGEENE